MPGPYEKDIKQRIEELIVELAAVKMKVVERHARLNQAYMFRQSNTDGAAPFCPDEEEI